MKYLKKYAQYSLNENEQGEPQGDKITFASDIMIRMVVTTATNPKDLPLTAFALKGSEDTFMPLHGKEITLTTQNGGFTSKGAANVKAQTRNSNTKLVVEEPQYVTLSFSRKELAQDGSFTLKISDFPESFKFKNKLTKLNYIKAISQGENVNTMQDRFNGAGAYKFDLVKFQNGNNQERFFKVKDGSALCTLKGAINVIYLIYCPDEIVSKEPLAAKFTDAFKYNSIEVDKTSKSYLAEMEKVINQLKSGTKYDMISHGSASKVPTKFENPNAEADEPKSGNEALAHARAKALGKAIREDAKKAGINLDDVLNSAKVTFEVAGPDYENDSENIAKYAPYQFVEIRLTPLK